MPKKKPHWLSRLRFYVTLLMSVVLISTCFALLFLVPFVYDPAISTLRAEFPRQPRTCLLTQLEVGTRLSACNWTSCSEGCTAPLTHCVQLHVDVSHVPFDQFELGRAYDESVWTERDLPLLVNIQACGYPPLVNCSLFWLRLEDAALAAFGEQRPVPSVRDPPDPTTPLERLFNHSRRATFPVPCFPSAAHPELVIFQYDHAATVHVLLMGAALPALALASSLGFLCYCYCGYCKRNCPQLHIPGEQDKLSMLPPELTASTATSLAGGK